MASSLFTDQTLNPGLPIPDAQLEQIAAIGHLRGISVRDVGQARVLEIGCGCGANLLSMAECLPGSQFLGLDRSPRAIAAASDTAQALGLSNVEFRDQDILEFADRSDPFDFILAQRAYSQIGPSGRDELLAICRRHLASLGIALVGCDTYPGWHLRDVFRHMILYSARGAPADQMIARGRTLFDFLSSSMLADHSPYQALALAEVDALRQAEDWQLQHELLSAVSRPSYFRPFVALARSHGLQFVGDCAVGIRFTDELTADIEKGLAALTNDVVEQEQYRDVLRNRAVRFTLLCHENVEVARSLSPDRLSGLFLSARLRPENPEIAIEATALEAFAAAKGMRVSTGVPLIKAAFVHLDSLWPQAIAVDELIAEATRSSELHCRAETTGEPHSATVDSEIARLRQSLLECSGARIIEVLSRPHAFTVNFGEKPVASPLARWQAARGNVVVNRKHQALRLDSFDQQIVHLLDGNRDAQALINLLSEQGLHGQLEVSEEGQTVTNPERLRELLGVATSRTLVKLAQNALLVG